MYRSVRGSLLVLIWLAGLCACDELLGPATGTRLPEVLTTDELAVAYRTRVGKELILNGTLLVTPNGEYRLAPLSTDHSNPLIRDFRVRLLFDQSQLDHDRMRRCLSGPVTVSGTLLIEREMSVFYAMLTSDVRSHSSNYCYDIWS